MPTRKRPKRTKRDYSRKRFRNPLGDRTRPRISLPWKRTLLPLAVVVAAGGWIWFIAFSNAFRIADIRIEGNDRIQDWEIRDAMDDLMAERWWFVIPKRSLILLPEKEIREHLLNRFVLDEVAVLKDPPQTLQLTVTERVSSIFMIMPDGSQAMLDLAGAVVRTYRPDEALEIARGYGPTLQEQVNPAEGLPVLFDDRNADLDIRDETVGPDVVDAVITIPGTLEDVFGPSVRSDEIHIDGFGTTTLRVITTEGWSVYLNAEKNVSEQLSDAKTVIDGKLGNDRRTLEYVDVRFGEKIFIKTR